MKYKGKNLDPPTDVSDIVLNDFIDMTGIVVNGITDCADSLKPPFPPITDRDRQSDTYSSLNVINVYKT